MIADPRLVRAGELWRIGPTGPAIDAAEELAWVPTDMDGQRRDRPDIGADALATDLRARDDSDRARMQPAADALEIDTSDLDVEDVVDRIEALVRERLPTT